MLCVTCGDEARRQLEAAGCRQEILVWQDILHEGPVPAGLDLDALRAVRARFIGAAGWAPEAEALAMLGARDRALAASLAHDEVVLWFDHNLVNQLQLLQLLDWFAARGGAARVPRLSLVDLPSFGGATTAELLAAHRARRPAGAEQLALGAAAWAAFRSPDPRAVEALLAAGTAALPALGGALRRHLEQVPGVGDGLSRAERHALAAIADGARGFEEVFLAEQRQEERPFIGDVSLRGWLVELAGGRAPLLAADADGWRLTGTGAAVLAGEADRVAQNGIDRWHGGVHLAGTEVPWRWDPAAARLVRS
jgi:hypothetical protein